MAESKTPKRLFKRFETMAAGSIADEIYAIAENIESNLLYTGAKPGIDYTYLDLIKLSQPFILEKWKKGHGKLEFICPASEVLS